MAGTLDLLSLSEVYAGLDVGTDGVVTLFRTDGRVMTRDPFVEADYAA